MRPRLLGKQPCQRSWPSLRRGLHNLTNAVAMAHRSGTKTRTSRWPDLCRSEGGWFRKGIGTSGETRTPNLLIRRMRAGFRLAKGHFESPESGGRDSLVSPKSEFRSFGKFAEIGGWFKPSDTPSRNDRPRSDAGSRFKSRVSAHPASRPNDEVIGGTTARTRVGGCRSHIGFGMVSRGRPPPYSGARLPT